MFIKNRTASLTTEQVVMILIALIVLASPFFRLMMSFANRTDQISNTLNN